MTYCARQVRCMYSGSIPENSPRNINCIIPSLFGGQITHSTVDSLDFRASHISYETTDASLGFINKSYRSRCPPRTAGTGGTGGTSWKGTELKDVDWS